MCMRNQRPFLSLHPVHSPVLSPATLTATLAVTVNWVVVGYDCYDSQFVPEVRSDRKSLTPETFFSAAVQPRSTSAAHEGAQDTSRLASTEMGSRSKDNAIAPSTAQVAVLSGSAGIPFRLYKRRFAGLTGFVSFTSLLIL
jgi:hypothetical protein